MRSLLAILILVTLAAAPAPTTRPQAGVAKNDPAKPQPVAIKSMQFQPPTLTIKPGQTVIWTNSDDRDHTVVATDGSFKSGNLASGATFQFTFKKKGKFPYACSYHPRMKAVIIVAE